MALLLPWTMYPARPLSDLPPDIAKVLDRDFPLFKQAVRALGIKVYEFVGLDPNVTCEYVTDYDLSCVEAAGLLFAIRPCSADGVAGEIAWKCSRREHVIVAVPKGCKVSRFTRGWRSRNPNFQYIEYENLLDTVPVVEEHFKQRTDRPKILTPGLGRFSDPATSQPLFRQRPMPVAS